MRVYPDLRRSLDETNKRIRRGEVSSTDIIFSKDRWVNARPACAWFGIAVEFDNVEVGRIISSIDSEPATIAALSRMLEESMAITKPTSVVAAIVSGLLCLGSLLLATCNSRQ